MNKLHKELLNLIIEENKKNPFTSKHNTNYEGHCDKSYRLSNPQLRRITKAWLEKHANLNFNNFIQLLNSLYKSGNSFTEKYIAGFIIEYSSKLRKSIEPKLLDNWLNRLTGWAQVDSLCQSRFDSQDLLLNWYKWNNLLGNLNKSKNINKRRASLVLLTKPVRDSNRKEFAGIAIQNIENIKQEKNILITKAISWLLREMIKNHRNLIKNYLTEKGNSLPAIAVKETRLKLKTGRKQ